MIHFRDVTIADHGTLLDLLKAYYHYEELNFDRKKVSKAFKLIFDHPEFGQAWLIMNNETVADYVILTMGFSFEYHGFDSFLEELFILEEFRRPGKGRRVIVF